MNAEIASRLVRATVCASIGILTALRADAQTIRPATPAAALGVNVLIGGITAGVRAAFEHHDVARAVGIGTLGGAVHYGGKWMASRHGDASGWTGTAIAATGTSIVVNAGAGVDPLSEVVFPLPALRVRVRPMARKVGVSLNAFDVWMLATNVGKAHTSVDWARTARTGAFVLETDRDILTDDRFVGGIALGPTLVMNGNDVRTWKHEATHVQQWWFAQEAVGRPVENALRARTRLLSWIPTWVDVGVVVPAIVVMDEALFDYGHGISNLMETEATLLGRR